MKKRYLSFVDVISVLICFFLIAFWLMFIAGTFWGELHLVNNALLWLAPAEVTLILMELKRKYEKSNTLHIIYTIITLLFIKYLPAPFVYILKVHFILMIGKFVITSKD